MDLTRSYNTELSPEEELSFKMWFAQMKKEGKIYSDDIGQDYDFRGFFKELLSSGKDLYDSSADTHFTDKYKKPNHETFSNESIYATGSNAVNAGRWEGDNFIKPILKFVPSLIEVLREEGI